MTVVHQDNDFRRQPVTPGQSAANRGPSSKPCVEASAKARRWEARCGAHAPRTVWNSPTPSPRGRPQTKRALIVNAPFSPLKYRVLLCTAIALAILFVIGVIALTTSLFASRTERANSIRRLANDARQDPNDRTNIDKLYGIARNARRFDRVYAINQIGRLSVIAHESRQLLLELSDSGDQAIESESVKALGELRLDDDEVVSVLIDKLELEGVDTSWFAAHALGQIGVDSPRVIVALERAKHSSDRVLAESARQALIKLGEKRKDMWPAPGNLIQSE